MAIKKITEEIITCDLCGSRMATAQNRKTIKVKRSSRFTFVLGIDLALIKTSATQRDNDFCDDCLKIALEDAAGDL